MSNSFLYKINNFEPKIFGTKFESIKKKIFLQSIKILQEEINLRKYKLSELSSFIKNKNKKNFLIKKDLEKENRNLLLKNEILKKEIISWREKYKNISDLSEKNIEQLKYIKITAEEQNFILENKLKEKDALIQNIKSIICNLAIGSRNFEMFNEIDEDYLKKEGGFEKITENILKEDRILCNHYLILDLKKQNRIIQKNKILIEEKSSLMEYLSKCPNKRDEINFNQEKIINTSANSENIVQTKVSTNESISADSLLFDTDDQIDIEFSDNEFSSHKSLGLNLNKEKKKIIIPKLDLRLINFNLRNISSYQEKSLSRNFIFELSDDKKKNQDIIEENIDKLKELIKDLKKKNKNLKNKCKKYENKIGKLAPILCAK